MCIVTPIIATGTDTYVYDTRVENASYLYDVVSRNPANNECPNCLVTNYKSLNKQKQIVIIITAKWFVSVNKWANYNEIVNNYFIT